MLIFYISAAAGLIYSIMSQALILPQYPGDFSLSGHTHSQYLTSHQSLSSYATKTYVDNAIAGIDTSTVPTHTHSGYASSTHSHSSYASSTHTHSTYASKSHTHESSDITGGGSTSYISKEKLNIKSADDNMVYLLGVPDGCTMVFVVMRKNDTVVNCGFVKPGENIGNTSTTIIIFQPDGSEIKYSCHCETTLYYF